MTDLACKDCVRYVNFKDNNTFDDCVYRAINTVELNSEYRANNNKSNDCKDYKRKWWKIWIK